MPAISHLLFWTGRLARTCRIAIVLWTVCLALAGEDFSRGLADRAEVVRAAAAVEAARFPNADEVLVDAVLDLRYQPDGTYVQWDEQYVKVLTERGRRNRSTLSSSYTIPYQQAEDCTIPLVEIIKPDGRTVPIDVAANSSTQIDGSSMGANIYNPNDKVMRVNIPGLEVGDLLHAVLYDRVVRPRMADTWCEHAMLEETRPIVRKEIRVHAPAGRPIAAAKVKDVVPKTLWEEVRPEGGGRLHRYIVRDVPQLIPEPNMPPLSTVAGRLLLSTAPDWPTVSRWYWKLCEPHLAATVPALGAKVAELVRTAGEDEAARIQALFRFVSQEVRYLGITKEAEAPGYEPHDVKETFERRHGVCRDKAALLVAMLREAGFTAFPTLIHNGARKDPEVAQPYFNHAIVAVRRGDTYQLMDPTDETTKEIFPAYLNDKSYLVARPEGEKLLTAPIVPAEKNLLQITTTAAVDATGRLTARTVLRFEGINDNAYRGYFARVKPDNRRQYFAGLVKAVAPGARLEECRIMPEDLKDMTCSLEVTLGYQAVDFPVAGDELCLLRLPVIGNRAGMVNWVLGATGLPSRRFPFQIDVACGVSETIDLTCDPALGGVVELPRYQVLDQPDLTWRPVVESRGLGVEPTARPAAAKVLRFTGTYLLKALEYSPERYRVLKESIKTIEADLKQTPILRRPALDDQAWIASFPQADLAVLDQVLDFDLENEHEATIRTRSRIQVLTYAGTKAAAEQKQACNSAWDEVRLESAQVTAKDGTVQKVAPEEVNTMDAGWVAAARRYPPGRIVVAGLPGVAVGSVIETTWVRRLRKRPFLGACTALFGYDPILRSRLILRLPAGLDPARLRQQLYHGQVVQTSQRDEAGRRILEWSVSRLPPVRREESLPPGFLLGPTLAWSLGDWKTYASQVAAALTPAAGPELAAVAAEVGRDRKGRALIQALRDAVAIRVRGIGPELDDLPLSAVTPAATTLADGYGNGTDRAVLLHALLAGAGFAPRFVLASDLHLDEVKEQATALPRRDAFPAVLVAVADPEGGPEILLGDTSQYDQLGVCRHRGRLGLDLANGAIIRSLEGLGDEVRVLCDLRLEPTGDAVIAYERQVFGAGYGSARQLYEEMRPELRRRHFLEMAAEISQAAVVTGEPVTDFSSYPGRVVLTMQVPRYAVASGSFLHCQVLSPLRGALRLRADTRMNPLLIDDERRGTTTVTLHIPDGFVPAMLPQPQRLGLPLRATFALERQTVDDRTLHLRFIETLEPTLLPADRYGELLDLQRRLQHADTDTVVLRREQSER